jgi:DNA repair protein RecO
MSIIKTCAILIKSRKYKEKDKLLTFYTEDLGKIVARCKGARDPLNHWGHNSEPPNICWLQLYERAGFYIVTEIKPVFNLFVLSADMNRIIAFETFVGLLDQLVEEHLPSRNFFGTCVSFLTRLNQENSNPAYLSYHLAFDFLTWQGTPVHLSSCVFCQEPYAENREDYSLSYSDGGLVCKSCSQKKNIFNPVSRESILYLLAIMKQCTPTEEERLNVFFQNWEDLDRIVKGYFMCLFSKKLLTYLGLKKL